MAGLSEQARVLFVNDTSRNGGPGRSLYTILRFLDPKAVFRGVLLPRQGVISELYRSRGVADALYFEPKLVENPIEPYARPMERTDFDAPWALKAVRALRNVGKASEAVLRIARLVRDEDYDLIYCNGTNADFAGGALALLTGRPVIWHVRYTSIPKWVVPVHTRLARSDGVRRIVCVSEASASLFPYCRDKVRVIHNALDLSEFSPSAVSGTLRETLSARKDTVIVGSHGRVLPRKGYREMLHAAKEMVHALTPEERARVRFVVVGDTPEDYTPDHVAECRATADALGIGSLVHFTGFAADVRPLVADFDIAVVPSVYADPLPRAVIESMALAKPVVAFRLGGVSEMVRDGETGRLLSGEPPDVKGLASAMLSYFRSASLRREHGEKGRQVVLEKYDARRHAEAIFEQIQEVLLSQVLSDRSPPQ